MRGAVGTPCRMTLDVNDPEYAPPGVGDFLTSEAGSCYEVQAARQVRSKKYPRRWSLKLLRFDPTKVPDDARVIIFDWNSRDRRR